MSKTCADAQKRQNAMSLAQALQPVPSLPLARTWPGLVRGALAANVAGLLLVSLWLRTTELDHLPGINGDEAWYGIQAVRWLQREPISWRTPTNNVLNPFFLLPLILMHGWLAPSAVALRLPAVISGVLALPLNYWLCRRVFDRPTALVSTILLAVLPINLAYSRFGWDASQTLLATLPAVYLPLLALKDGSHRQHWLVAAALAFLASLVVHPTNIFTAPLLAMPALWAWRTELFASLGARPVWQRAAGAVAGCAVVVAVGWLARHWLSAMFQRLLAPQEYWLFAWNYERLFSGITAYRYLAGSNTPAASADVLLLDVAFWLLLALAAWGMWHRRIQTPGLRELDGCALAGGAFMLCGFFLVAGGQAIAPHYERYGLCLIAPGAVLLSRGLAAWFDSSVRAVALAAMLSMAWLTLIGFHSHYIDFIHLTGGMSHETFRTAELEPKQAALAEILRHRDAERETWIVTAEYWNEKPLTYLSAHEKGLRVESWPTVLASDSFWQAARQGDAWFIEFAGSPACRKVRETLHQRGLAFEEMSVNDYAVRKALVVIRTMPR
jgi:hypothetical protein